MNSLHGLRHVWIHTVGQQGKRIRVTLDTLANRGVEFILWRLVLDGATATLFKIPQRACYVVRAVGQG